MNYFCYCKTPLKPTNILRIFSCISLVRTDHYFENGFIEYPTFGTIIILCSCFKEVVKERRKSFYIYYFITLKTVKMHIINDQPYIRCILKDEKYVNLKKILFILSKWKLNCFNLDEIIILKLSLWWMMCEYNLILLDKQWNHLLFYVSFIFDC
jgi:hypothetical protein